MRSRGKSRRDAEPAEEKPGSWARRATTSGEQVAALEARLAVLKAAPSILSLEVQRLERETVNRLDELRDVFARNPREARKVIERLLDGGKLTFTRFRPSKASGTRSRAG